MTSEREIVSSNQKTTGTRGFPTGCFANADELSGKLVFSGVREGFRSGGLEHFRFSPSHGTLYLFVFAQLRTQTAAHFCWYCSRSSIYIQPLNIFGFVSAIGHLFASSL
ncbi:hypothetical protein ACCT30_29500, partial [Rhizobium ruizarguesonis]